MAAVPPVPPERRRPRPGSLERPVNGRLYRGTWLLLGLPLLVAAFSVARPVPLPPPQVSSGFDGANATSLAKDLADHYPNRFPGSAGALGAATWLRDQFRSYGFEMRTEPFTAVVPGRGRVELQNLIAEAVGRSPQTIVVMAHRDDDGTGQGANDNASGTAALVQLARWGVARARRARAPGVARRARPAASPPAGSRRGGARGLHRRAALPRGALARRRRPQPVRARLPPAVAARLVVAPERARLVAVGARGRSGRRLLRPGAPLGACCGPLRALPVGGGAPAAWPTPRNRTPDRALDSGATARNRGGARGVGSLRCAVECDSSARCSS